MMALGTGVSWFDDHAPITLYVPRVEAHTSGGKDLDYFEIERSPKRAP
jgi:hypothetical protein